MIAVVTHWLQIFSFYKVRVPYGIRTIFTVTPVFTCEALKVLQPPPSEGAAEPKVMVKAALPVFEKANAPMTVAAGKFAVVRLVQPVNVLLSIVVASGKLTVVKLEQLKKAPVPPKLLIDLFDNPKM